MGGPCTGTVTAPPLEARHFKKQKLLSLSLILDALLHDAMLSATVAQERAGAVSAPIAPSTNVPIVEPVPDEGAANFSAALLEPAPVIANGVALPCEPTPGVVHATVHSAREAAHGHGSCVNDPADGATNTTDGGPAVTDEVCPLSVNAGLGGSDSVSGGDDFDWGAMAQLGKDFPLVLADEVATGDSVRGGGDGGDFDFGAMAQLDRDFPIVLVDQVATSDSVWVEFTSKK